MGRIGYNGLPLHRHPQILSTQGHDGAGTNQDWDRSETGRVGGAEEHREFVDIAQNLSTTHASQAVQHD